MLNPFERKNGADDNRYERNTAKDGSFYFNLKAANGQVIGKSEIYTTAAAMENSIGSVGKKVPDA